MVETTVEIANKVGCAEVIGRVVEDLKDESEPYRKMVMETVESVVQNLGAADLDVRLEVCPIVYVCMYISQVLSCNLYVVVYRSNWWMAYSMRSKSKYRMIRK